MPHRSASNVDLKNVSRSPMVFAPAPTALGTICLLIGIAVAFASYPSQSSNGVSSMATAAAIPVGIGFLASLIVDYLKQGLRNLFRTDLMCLFGIYVLTLAEFLFPQEEFESMITVDEVFLSIQIVLIGIASLAIGRHLIKPKRIKSKLLSVNDISNDGLFKIIIISMLLGYLYKLMAVDFNLVEMLDAMTGARFTQPWKRGRLGGLTSLLTELQLMAYIVPPLAGITINRYKKFPKIQYFIVISLFLIVIFSSFAAGTRNVLVAHVATFLMGYLLTLKKNTVMNTVLPTIAAFYFVIFCSYHMLEFRTKGLKHYVQNEVYSSGTTRESIAVDFNLASMGWVASAMPGEYDFLGGELVYWAIIKPIPRAFFPGKPEKLSVSTEEIAGARGWTVAVTYLGEAYMSAGIPGVIVISLFLGALAAWWNRMAIMPQSDYGFVLYALGFFAAGLTMRSFIWLTTAMLPVIALVALRKFGPFK